MNRERRKELEKLIEDLELAKGVLTDALDNFRANIEDIETQLSLLMEEEEESFQNMPESLQQGAGGQASEAATEKMTEAQDALGEVVDEVQNAMDDKVQEILEALREAAQ